MVVDWEEWWWDNNLSTGAVFNFFFSGERPHSVSIRFFFSCSRSLLDSKIFLSRLLISFLLDDDDDNNDTMLLLLLLLPPLSLLLPCFPSGRVDITGVAGD